MGKRHGRLVWVFSGFALTIIACWEIVAGVISLGFKEQPDWYRASQTVRNRYRPGDLIVFAPTWIDPVGRKYLGDLIPIETAARMDSARFATIWQVALGANRASEVSGLRARAQWRFAQLTVQRFEQKPVTVLTDFVQALPHAKITGRMVGTPRVSVEEVGFAPRRCVVTIPKPGQTATLRYESVRMGSELVGYVGLGDVFTRRDIRAPGRLSIFVEGDHQSTITVGVEDGWVRFAVPTPLSDASTVTFTAQSMDPSATNRRICFAAEARL